jgi:membrane protease subunit (stomatin/prohibitin family)
LVKQNLPLLNVTSGALTEEIEQIVVEAVKPHLVDYGMRIVRMGNFVVDMKEEDEAQLKAMYKDAAQLRMMGGNLNNYQQFAAGKAMMGAGEGMAKGGGDGGGGNPMLGGAGLGVGFAMANSMGQAGQQGGGNAGFQQQAPSAPQGGMGQVTCGKCNAKVNPGKFCAECGATLAEKKQFCAECGKPMVAGAKFCAECGAKTTG